MNWLIDALFHAFFLWIPTWVWLVAFVTGLVIILRIFGWKATLVAAAGVAVFLATSFGARKGRDAQIKEDIKHADKVLDKARKAREDATRQAADPDHRFDDDGYRVDD